MKAAAVVVQHLPDHIFGHALRQIRIDDAHDRDIGKRRISHQRIDTGAEIDDRLQVRQFRQRARLRLPDRGISDGVRVIRLVGMDDVQSRRRRLVAKIAKPEVRRPTGDSDEKRHDEGSCRCNVRRISGTIDVPRPVELSGP